MLKKLFVLCFASCSIVKMEASEIRYELVQRTTTPTDQSSHLDQPPALLRPQPDAIVVIAVAQRSISPDFSQRDLTEELMLAEDQSAPIPAPVPTFAPIPPSVPAWTLR